MSANDRSISRDASTPLLDKYGSLFDRIAAGAIERERERRLPYEEMGWLKSAGFASLRVPREQGGDGASIVEVAELLIALATADPSLTQALRGHIVFSEDRLFAPASTDRDVWLKRFAAGEIVGNAWTEIGNVSLWETETTLDREGDLYRLNGRKFYTTGSIFADWIDVLSRREDGVNVLALVRTETEGVDVTDDWDGFGQRTTGSGQAVFSNAKVDSNDVFLFDERVPYQHALFQLVLLAALAGIGKAILRDTSDQIRKRTRVYSTSTGSADRYDPQIQQIVGQLAAYSFATEAASLRAAASLDRAFDARQIGAEALASATQAANIEVYTAQIIVTDFTQRAAALLFNALSASSTREHLALDRHWRNARTISSHNPVINKERFIGDWFINATPPPVNWSIGIPLPAKDK